MIFSIRYQDKAGDFGEPAPQDKAEANIRAAIEAGYELMPSSKSDGWEGFLRILCREFLQRAKETDDPDAADRWLHRYKCFRGIE